jgi:hypothetical protein
MTTETAETAETTELPANLTAVPSGELHERAEALAVEADSLLESDRWEDYKTAAQTERRLRDEIERRGAAARKEVPVEAAKIPVAAQEKIEQTRQALAEAEKALEAFGAVKARPDGTPPAWGVSIEDADEPTREKAEAFTNVSQLKAELAALESRTAYVDISDEQIATDLEETGIEMESLRLDLKRFTEEGRRAAAARELNVS